jgi:hypothetical protein
MQSVVPSNCVPPTIRVASAPAEPPNPVVLQRAPNEPLVPSSLAAALAKARDNCPDVPRNGWNSYHNYKYPTAQDIITAGRKGLKDTGLALILSAPQLDTLGNGASQVFSLKRRVALAHASGESVDLGELRWPVIPDRGRPLDKALAAACTTSLGELYRDLLQMPAFDPAEDQAARNDTGEAPAAAPATAPASPPSTIDEAQQNVLAHMIRETGTDIAALCKHYQIRTLHQLTAAKYKEVYDVLAARSKAKTDSAPTPQAAPAPSTVGDPKERIRLRDSIDALATELKIDAAEWEQRLKQLFGTGNATQLSVEQLGTLEKRLLEYKARVATNRQPSGGK